MRHESWKIHNAQHMQAQAVRILHHICPRLAIGNAQACILSSKVYMAAAACCGADRLRYVQRLGSDAHSGSANHMETKQLNEWMQHVQLQTCLH